MANKFDRVLSDEEINQIVNGLIWVSGDSFCFGKDVAIHIIQAMQDKLEEKEPVAWRAWNKTTGFWGYSSTKPGGAICEPLYTHPMLCVSPTSDKQACDSQNEKYETQIPDGTFINEGTIHLERIKRYQKWRRGEDKTMDEMGINPKQLGESLDWLIDFVENHIVEARGMVGKTQKITLKVDARHVSNFIDEELNKISDKWQLVPKKPTEEMHNAARDWSIGRYGKAIGNDASYGCYKAMLEAAPKYKVKANEQ